MLGVTSNLGLETIGVASLNLLLDKTKSSLDKTHPRYVEPQHERIESLSKTLGSLPISLDVVMLQELHIERWSKHNNGKYLANSLGMDRLWYFNHNSKRRKGEHIAVCGHKVDFAYDIKIGDDRKALIAVVGDMALAGVHNRSGIENGSIRVDQTKIIVKELEHYDKAGIVGDTNARPGSRARNVSRDAGYTSVFTMDSESKPAITLPTTFPTNNYRYITVPPSVPLDLIEKTGIIPHAMSIDTIELRGFKANEVLQAGTVMTKKSDHLTLYAELAA